MTTNEMNKSANDRDKYEYLVNNKCRVPELGCYV